MLTKKILFFILTIFVITGCGPRFIDRTGGGSSGSYQSNQSYRAPIVNSSTPANLKHPTMRPYTVLGKRYYPTVVTVGETFNGRASWYGPNFHGKKTSNGETYNMWQMTAAHKTLPMNTVLRVTNKKNGRSVVVRVNDRGPFVNTRIIDLSKKAASELDMIKTGTALVKLEVLGFNKKGQTQITKTSMRKNVKEQVLGRYALQIGSFSRIEGAITTQERYNNATGRYKTIIKDVDTGNGRLFKVLLTGFGSDQEARDYKAKHFQSAFIVRE